MSRRQKKAIREKKQIASLCVQVALLRTLFQNIIQATVFLGIFKFSKCSAKKKNDFLFQIGLQNRHRVLIWMLPRMTA